MQIDLAGSRDVVLTMLAAAPAFIEVPRGPERYLVFARAAGMAVGEVSFEGASRLAVAAVRAEQARVAAAGLSTDETRSFASVHARTTLAATVALGSD